MAKFFINSFFSVAALTMFLSCSSDDQKGYVFYLVDPEIETDALFPESKTDKPIDIKPTEDTKAMKLAWNDGSQYSEVSIPLMASGQRIYIEHQTSESNERRKGPSLVPPAPSKNDLGHQHLLAAYKEKGLRINEKAAAISLGTSRELIEKSIRISNYPVALEYAQLVLDRYPDHAEFLRARGSILLLMGEKEKALAAYEQAQDIEFDPAVERKMKELNTF